MRLLHFRLPACQWEALLPCADNPDLFQTPTPHTTETVQATKSDMFALSNPGVWQQGEKGKRDHIDVSLPLTAMLQAGICNGCVLMKGEKNESKLVLQTCLAFLGLASFVYLCSLCSR